jgi:Major Facilitator Superfamily/Cyclic nucleotide-binding domain
MRRLAASLALAVGALRLTLADDDLRRMTISWFAINCGKWTFLVTNLVIAYTAGGPVAVGILGLARYLTPTVLAPFAGVPVARWPAERVLLAANTIRAVGVVLAVGVVATGAPIWALYLAVAVEAGAGAFTRPLQMAILPCIARTPAELVAANVTASAAEGLGTFVGPAIGGILLATTGPIGADLAVLLIYLIGLAAIVGLHVPTVGRPDGSVQAVVDQLSAGVRAVAHIDGPRLVFVGFGLQTLVRGLLTVLVVVAAVDVLDMGDPGVGALNAAMGLGGFIGAMLAIMLTGRKRLAPSFAGAMVGWGAPIAVIGLLTTPVVAMLAMVAIGISNALIDVAGFTLAQRTSPNDSRVAVLGLLDSAANAGVALGGILAPILIAWLGVRGALIVTGAILPMAALLVWPALRRVDEGGEGLALRSELIRGVPLFAPLSLATVDYLAARLDPFVAIDGQWLMREGESGDQFYLIETGDIEVTRDNRVLRTLGPGAGVGEIALLHDVPRSASVRAIGGVTGYALDRAAFVEAVTGHSASHSLAMTLVDERLAADASA